MNEELSQLRVEIREEFRRLHERIDEIARGCMACQKTLAAHEARLDGLRDRTGNIVSRLLLILGVVIVALASSLTGIKIMEIFRGG
ncbi:MAG: hypothetical protein N3A38_14940 [Planctomycetota bacterium]|nr:hypothetical protein [Planctomycetota bacterium]